MRHKKKVITMNEFPVTHWLMLWFAAMLGVVAVLPYQLALTGNQLMREPLAHISRSRIILLSLIQNGILLGVAAALGLLAARAVGLRTPILDALLTDGSNSIETITLLLAMVLGAGAGAAILALDLVVFYRHLPAALKNLNVYDLAPWKRFLAGFYGGITEEVLLRMFLMSGLLWLLRQLGVEAPASAWLAILVAAILFGAGHLPSVAMLTPLTPWVVMRTLVLNGVGGVVFGWLYWHYGLEWAMLAHFAADMVIQFGAPWVMRFTGKESLSEPAGQIA